ncbi:hypothetical protein MGAST_04560 [Mycobacterium gastri 'Wayne']|uniref:Uncharacterized protein n=1 Tax=Mycobacterium gastri TaxID=1777 RepID=A0A1X1VXQ3_MYCGS|nr:hypothetical protein MGAST_04560 [Mycobacterium gastri 'Wayne']ORV74439.1 hypothetical protein AWC07_25250 [Mycobacterium gastri]
MASDEASFKAFSSFGVDDLPLEAPISQRMLRRLEDIDGATTAGPTSAAARAALASNVVAHSLVELESGLIEPQRHAGRKRMLKPSVVGKDSANLAQQVSVGEAMGR